MARICVVDDNEILRESVAEALTREDHQVTIFSDPVEALKAIQATTFDCIISDLKMPGMDGVTLLREARSGGCEASFILMTAFASVDSAVAVMKLGAFEYIQKPFDAEKLCLIVDRAVQNATLRSENEALKRTLTDSEQREMIGDTPSMRMLREMVARIAFSSNT